MAASNLGALWPTEAVTGMGARRLRDGTPPRAPGGRARRPQAAAGMSAPWGPWAPLLAGHQCLCSGGHDSHPPTVSFWFPIHVSWGWGRGGSDSPSGHGLDTQIPPANPTLLPLSHQLSMPPQEHRSLLFREAHSTEMVLEAPFLTQNPGRRQVPTLPSLGIWFLGGVAGENCGSGEQPLQRQTTVMGAARGTPSL